MLVFLVVCTGNVLRYSKSQSNEDVAILRHFGREKVNSTDNVFVEIGGFDGLTYSNSYLFEKGFGWKTVLVEGSTANYERMRKNRPGAINIHGAICNKPNISFLKGSGAVLGVPEQMTPRHLKIWGLTKTAHETVPCYTWKTIFSRIGVQKVTVFSVDVEGAEYEVLNLMDWSIPVDLWLVEGKLENIDKQYSKENNVTRLLGQHGYRVSKLDLRRFCHKGQDCTRNIIYLPHTIGS